MKLTNQFHVNLGFFACVGVAWSSRDVGIILRNARLLVYFIMDTVPVDCMRIVYELSLRIPLEMLLV